MVRRNRVESCIRRTRALDLAIAGLALSISGTAHAQAPQKKAAPVAQPPAAVAMPKPSAAAGAPDDASIVARAGDRKLTREDIRAFVATMPAADQAALSRDPTLFSQTLRILLANQLVLKEANEKNWEQKPAIAAQINRARDNVIVESYLRAAAAPPDGFPSETELQQANEANKAQLVVPPQFQVAQIFIALPQEADKDATDKASKKLADVGAKLKQPGADFAAIAKTDSDERTSAERGGEIGWLAASQMRPEFRTAVAGMTKGTLSQPLRAADGWHILKLLDAKPEKPLSLAEVRDALANRLREQRAEANRRAYIAKLLEQSPPTINELALSQVLDQAQAEALPPTPATPQ